MIKKNFLIYINDRYKVIRSNLGKQRGIMYVVLPNSAEFSPNMYYENTFIYKSEAIETAERLWRAEKNKKTSEKLVDCTSCISRKVCFMLNCDANVEILNCAHYNNEKNCYKLDIKPSDTVWDRDGDEWTVTEVRLHLYGNRMYICGRKGTQDYMRFTEDELGENVFLSWEKYRDWFDKNRIESGAIPEVVQMDREEAERERRNEKCLKKH